MSCTTFRGVTDARWQQRARSFGTAAADYQRGRPGYPLDAIRWCLPPAPRTVLDLAAGTGKLTEGLLAVAAEGPAYDIVAVEPLDEMRALIPAQVRALPGTAEALPLDDGSVDAVLTGQAFHWFRRDEALAEMVRVLRPGGTVGMLWNAYDDRAAWVGEIADAMRTEARASLMASRAHPPYETFPGLTSPEAAFFAHEKEHDADSLVADVSSTSAVIIMAPEERAEVLARVRSAVPTGRFTLPYVCVAWRAEVS